MDKSREQFEEEYIKLMGTPLSVIMTLREDGNYRCTEGDRLQIAWKMWQASRATVKIQLESEWDINYDGSRHYDADSVDEKLSSFGLKVRQ